VLIRQIFCFFSAATRATNYRLPQYEQTSRCGLFPGVD
jgi:hypothetical protein